MNWIANRSKLSQQIFHKKYSKKFIQPQERASSRNQPRSIYTYIKTLLGKTDVVCLLKLFLITQLSKLYNIVIFSYSKISNDENFILNFWRNILQRCWSVYRRPIKYACWLFAILEVHDGLSIPFVFWLLTNAVRRIQIRKKEIMLPQNGRQVKQ